MTRYGQRVKIQEQPLRLLSLLIESRGETVSRDQIRNRLWPADTHVSFDKSLAVAVLKIRDALGDNAAAPIFVETIPRRGYRFVAPVSVHPDSAPAESASSLAAAEPPLTSPVQVVEDIPADASSPPSNLKSFGVASNLYRLRFAVLGGAALLGLLTTGAFFYHHEHHSTHLSPLASAEPLANVKDVRRSVAVLGFQNLSPQSSDGWLSSAFSEMLNTELASDANLRIVSAEDVAGARREELFESASTLSRPTLNGLHRSLGADLVVLGSYTMLTGPDRSRIRFDVRIQDTVTGETVAQSAFTGAETQIFDLASEAGNRLRETLTPSYSLATAAETERMPAPANQLALQLYSEGREKLYAFDFVGARDLLNRAVSADPRYPLAHSALSETLWHLGYLKLARDEGKLAFDDSHSLQQEPRLLIEGEYREMLNDWPAAVEIYRNLWRLGPDRLDYGLRLGRVQLHESATDALHTIAALRTLAPPQGDDPRIDLLEASVLVGQDLAGARAAAERAISKASARHSNLMLARGYGILCQQDAALGTEMQRSEQECEEARASYIGAGDRNNAARTLNDLAGLYYFHGDLSRAEQLWKESLVEFRAVGDLDGIAAASNNLGDALLSKGNLPAARVLLNEARKGYVAVSDRDGVALVDADLGTTEFQAGDLRTSKAHFQQATATALQNGNKSAAAYGMHGTGDVLVEAADFSHARDFYQRALELRQQVGEKQTSAESRLALARVQLLSGHAAEVEAAIQQCREQFHAEHQPDDELTAGLLLVRDLLQLKRQQQAEQELGILRALRSATQDRFLQLRFDIEEGRLLAAAGKKPKAALVLQRASKDSQGGGFQELRMEASLLLAQLSSADNLQARASRQLALLRAEQVRAGYLLLANSTILGKSAKQ